jgi:ATP-binding protein involved in chromosome partitioning
MKNIVPIISGKGGVGKSTVAVNLSVALAKRGLKVALIDSDFYGPSVPTLFGGGSISVDHEGKLIPPEKFGVKYISLGFFLSNPDEAVVWRGPMFNKALTQLFSDVNWGSVDLCIVDMPPGTGDAQISLSQLVAITGAVVVTTPQEVALADVRKSINMLKKVNIPVLGIVENMAGYQLPDGTLVPIFGEGGGQKTADEFGVPLWTSIPLDPLIREGGDIGAPTAEKGDEGIGHHFGLVADKLLDSIATHRRIQPEIVQTEIIS